MKHNKTGIFFLQAKVQGAQLQKQLEESDVTSSSETVSGFSGVTASLPSVSEQPTSKNRKELPVIMEINGKDKRLNAVLRMADGRQTSVTTGSQLPVHIRHSEVDLIVWRHVK